MSNSADASSLEFETRVPGTQYLLGANCKVATSQRLDIALLVRAQDSPACRIGMASIALCKFSAVIGWADRMATWPSLPMSRT